MSTYLCDIDRPKICQAFVTPGWGVKYLQVRMWYLFQIQILWVHTVCLVFPSFNGWWWIHYLRDGGEDLYFFSLSLPPGGLLRLAMPLESAHWTLRALWQHVFLCGPWLSRGVCPRKASYRESVCGGRLPHHGPHITNTAFLFSYCFFSRGAAWVPGAVFSHRCTDIQLKGHRFSAHDDTPPCGVWGVGGMWGIVWSHSLLKKIAPATFWNSW